jgi:hypothetical protein
MNITQITVSYGETQSLPEYSNVKPNLTITATLGDGELAEEVETELWKMAKESVHAQIDQALEGSGKAAKYSTDPRYRVMRTIHDSYNRRGKPVLPPLVTIIPNELELDDRFTSTGWPENRKLRYAHAQRVAAETAVDLGANIVDCSSGDFSALMALLPEEPAEAPVAKQEDDLGGPGGADIYAAAFEEDDDEEGDDE